MAATDPVEHVSPAARVEGDPTPGMVRERAIDVDGLWAGYVTTEPGAASGWHHHGDYETSIYVVDGALRMEFGAGGNDVIEASAGDFLRVPPHAVHREANPGSDASHLVVVRAGHGPPTINVDGPAQP